MDNPVFSGIFPRQNFFRSEELRKSGVFMDIWEKIREILMSARFVQDMAAILEGRGILCIKKPGFH